MRIFILIVALAFIFTGSIECDIKGVSAVPGKN